LKKQHDITNQEIGEWLFDPSVPPIDENTVNQTEDALILFAAAHSVEPPAALRHTILAKIKDLNAQTANHQQLDVNALPLLNEESKWL